ncbi:MAG: alpha/beta fold hydrolase [Alteromonadaceae bacterium]|nr:alpha/beta fold hydrolase [Alteromonadaceae bacterium]
MIAQQYVLPTGLRLAGFSLAQWQDNKPVVLCTHGWLDNANTWLPLFLELEQCAWASNYNWLAIDFAGHGDSAHRSADAHYHHTDYVFDLYALIQSQQWQSVILLGHSMGGIVSSSLSSVLPQNIQQLICIEAMGPLSDSEKTTVEQMQNAFNSRLSVYQKTIKQPSDWEALIKAKQHAGGLNESHAAIIMERNVNLSHTGLTWKTDPRLRTQSTLRFTHEQARKIMQNISCPVTLMMGQDGFERVATQATSRKSWLSQFDSVSLPGNHYVHMQQPEALVKILEKLIES